MELPFRGVITDGDVAQVRAATDFARLACDYLALTRVGGRLVGRCPFHSGGDASFTLHVAEGFYVCSDCRARGDVVSFVQGIEHVVFEDAVRFLAVRSGVELESSA